ncbi:MAG: hypothetical protein HY282_05200 [Nitrospirae bacterium]|nr:hypothetical protein [Candidatus Manganitrophaceae bacterium]
MAEIVYVLSALTSLTCALLLLKGYLRSHTRLLFWSSLCFFGLAANNIILFVDLVIVPEIDLSILRLAVALLGLIVLLYGLIWDTA